MRFDIITIFPNIFDSYLNESILGRAQKNNLIEIKMYNLRDFTNDKHKTVDDSPYGGGAGMVLMAEPILKAVDKITKNKTSKKRKIIVFSAKGKQFNQKMAYDWSKKLDQLVFICGRYEGIDERVVKILKAEEISIGPYVLTDGEVPAMAIISAVARLIPGVIKLESLSQESHKDTPQGESLEYPHFTRPEILKYHGKKYHVPEILLSGDHKKIEAWRAGKRIQS